MEVYIIVGKWPYARFGLQEYVDQRVVYIPKREIKFCADDRDVRTLYNSEDVTLERMLDILCKSDSNHAKGHPLKSKSTIFIFKKKIDDTIFEKILKAYGDKNREFFFTNSLFQKSSKL